MGLHFIFGRAGTGKSTRCAREIEEYVKGGKGRKAILLVPDQGTYTAEYQLARSFKGEGFVNVMVCGFSRLAYRVFQELHSPVSDALSPLGQQIILRKLMEESRDQLKIITKAASHPHFSEELSAFFHQLDMFCVSEKDMENAAEAEGDTPLGRKLEDLHLLYRAYHAYLKDHFDYEGSLFDLLAREIPKSSFLRSSRVWIDGFNGMAPQKIHIVSALIHTAEEVTMTLQMDSPEEAADNPNFARPFRLFSLLSREEGHTTSVTLRENHRFLSSGLAEMASSFFNRRAEESTISHSAEDGLHIIRTAHRAEEVDFIARKILSLVRDHHYRFRNIAILLRSPDQYTDLFERSFAKYEIPGFIDKKHPMNNHPLVVLLDGLVRFLTMESRRKNSGWQRDILFPMLKTFLLPEWEREEVDQLENYVLSHSIRPWQYHSPWEFRSFYDLDGPVPPFSDEEREEMEEVNRWREKLIQMLDPLTDAWKNAPLPEDRCRILYEWMMEKKIPDTLSHLDEKEQFHTNLRPHLQVWKKILFLLDEIVHTTGKDELSEKDFLSIFEDGLSALTYSTIPPTIDHVTVTGMDRGYAIQAKVLFIPGAIEGEFPKRVEERGFFTELEKQKIFSQSQLVFGASLMEEVHKEQFFTYLALTRARHDLFITFPSVNDDKNETEPSFLLTRLKNLGYPSEVRTLSENDWEKDPSFFGNPSQVFSLLPSLLREKIPETSSPWSALVSWAEKTGHKEELMEKLSCFFYDNKAATLPRDLAAKIFKPGGRFLGSVTRFENYRSCPYRYFLQYGLRIEERDEGDIESLDFGNYLHAGLHQFGDAMMKKNKQWRDASDEDIEKISGEIASHLVPKVRYGVLHSDGASRYTEKALNETFRNALANLRKWSRNSRFDTKALEKEFYLHIRGDHDTFTLKGKIDRIDATSKAAAVFDYKTGHPKITLQEVVAGLKLQLLTYLLEVKEEGGGNLLPAALMYIYLSGDVKSPPAVPPGSQPDIKDKDNMSGWILNDPSTVRELDEKAGEDDSFLSVAFNKDGSLAKKGALMTEEDFNHLLSIVKHRLISLYHSMEEGKIPIRPVNFKKQAPCRYCPYHSICRFDPKNEGESYEYIHLPSDTELKGSLKDIAEGKENHHE